MWDVSETHRIERYAQYAVPGSPALVCVWREEHIDACHYFFNEVAKCLQNASSLALDPAAILDLEAQVDDLARLVFSMWESLYEYSRG